MKTFLHRNAIIINITILFIASFSGVYAQSQDPYGGTPRTIPGTIQATEFDTGGEGIAYHDLTPENEGDVWNYRTTEGVDIFSSNDCGPRMVGLFKNGEWMEYTVNVYSGTYDISIRVAAATPGKQLKAYLDNRLIATFDVPNTGSYDIYQTVTIKNIFLSGGTAQILKLENVNNDFNYDWIKFERSDAIIQAPYQGIPRTIPGTIQALDFDEGGEGIAYHDLTPVNKGFCWRNESVDTYYAELYAVGDFENGEWLEYTVNVDPGAYDISLRVAANTTGKQLKAYLDDSLFVTIDIPNSRDYHQIYTVKNIVLSGGTRKILKLENVNGNFGFEWIKFEPAGVIKTQAPLWGIPWTIPSTIPAEDYDTGGEGIAYHDVSPYNEGERSSYIYRVEENVDVLFNKVAPDAGFFVGWFKHGEWMEYTLNVDSAAYDISIRVAATFPGKQLKAYLDDSLVVTFDVPNTGSYNKYQTVTANNIILPGGKRKILKLENVNDDFDLDWIKFERADGRFQDPYGGNSWSIPGTIEAENFDDGGEGLAYHDVSPANEGGEYRPTESVDISFNDNEYVVGQFKKGEWMEYTVSIYYGMYNISIMAAADTAGGQLKAYLDDSLVATFDIPNTHNTYQIFTINDIFLSGTGKILRLENESNDFDLNWIKFERIELQNPIRWDPRISGYAPWKIPGAINAADYDIGGEGKAYHDVTPANEGDGYYRRDEGVDLLLKGEDNIVGWFKHGEWMEYTVDVDSGAYNISIRVAAEVSGKQLKAYLDDSLFVTFDIPNTGSFNNYKIYTAYNIFLPGGNHKILKLENVNNDFDFHWIKFERAITLPRRAIPGTIQAEDFDLGGEGTAYHDVTPANEGWSYRKSEGVDIGISGDANIVGWFKNGEWMNYTVDVDSGTYDISVRVAAVAAGKQLKAYLNDNLIATFNIPNTGSYDTYQTSTVKSILLPGGGSKKLRLENVNNDFDLNWIQFERAEVNTQAPYGGTPRTIPGIIQAEEFDTGGEGLAYHDVTPAVNEGGENSRTEGVDIGIGDNHYVIGWFENGEWLEYTVNVEPGTYDISIRIATETTGKQLKAYLDDSLISIFDVPNTGGYKTFQTYTVHNIELKGGISKILRLENVNGDFNLNWIKFERVGIQAPYGGTPRMIPGIIQTEDFDEGGRGIAYLDVSLANEGGAYRTTESVDIKTSYCGSDTITRIGLFKNGEWMEYTVNVDAGTYDISIRVAAEEAGKQLKAYLSDSLIATFDIPNTGNYFRYQTYTIKNIVLAGGTSKILKLENVNNDFNFDWIQFERAGTKIQTPYRGVPRTIPGTIEAEDFDEGGEGIAYHDDTPINIGGCWGRTNESVDVTLNGNAYIVGWFKKGEWMEYIVNVESGIYDISIRVATPGTGRQLKAYLDDRLITTFHIPKTGSYKAYQTRTVKNIVLSGGSSKILKLENVNGDFDINWIKFTKKGNSVSQTEKQSQEPVKSSSRIRDLNAASLLQNTPNPFNQTTRIEYYLPETVRNAVIYIHNMYGLRIKSIPLLNNGNGTITINGSELQPGMYIYSLFADGQEVDAKRMILIK